jgi:hypothetical protein
VVAAYRRAAGFSCRQTTDFGWCEIHEVDSCHGAATPAHAAGADLKDMEEMLGHSLQ